MRKNNNINSGVYGIYTRLKNNLLYIGNSIDLENRYKNHYNDIKNKSHVNKELIKFADIYGFDNLIFKPIFFCEKEDLIYWETFFIKLFSPVCNKTHIIKNTLKKEPVLIGSEYEAIYTFFNENQVPDIIKTNDIIDMIYKNYNVETTAVKVSLVLKQKGYKGKQLSDGARVFVKQ